MKTITSLINSGTFNPAIKHYLDSDGYGKNYIVINATGTATENFAELQSKYNLLKLYKGNWSYTSAYAVGEIVTNSGINYKRLTIGDAFVFPTPTALQTDNAYWQFIEESENPFTNIYDLQAGYKNMQINEIVQIEVYDEGLEWSGYRKYKCLQPIILPSAPSADPLNWEIYTGKIYDVPSNTNRYTLALSPGYYQGVFQSTLQYVNIVSLTGNKDVYISGFEALANNVYVRGIVTTSSRFALGNNLSTLTVENCTSPQNGSFSVGVYSPAGTNNIISGTFIDCQGATVSTEASFGYGEQVNGTFIRCTCTRFATKSSSTGVFIDCVSTEGLSFGYTTSVAEYPYVNANGTYYRCISKKTGSFGGQCNGKFYYCVVESGGMGFGGNFSSNPVVVKSTGEFYNCIAGVYSYGGCYGADSPNGYFANSIFAGRAYNCIGGWGSYGGTAATAGVDGILVNCIIVPDKGIGSEGDLMTFKTPKGRACTISVATGAVITIPAHNKAVGNSVKFSSTGTLPAGLLPNTKYYVLSSGLTADTFKISLTPNGTPVTTTNAGTGTHSVILGQYINCVDGTGAVINSNN